LSSSDDLAALAPFLAGAFLAAPFFGDALAAALPLAGDPPPPLFLYSESFCSYFCFSTAAFCSYFFLTSSL